MGVGGLPQPIAAGAFRRTTAERSDQRLSWERPDRAFFAAGACHVLAWTCRETYADRPIGLAALRFVGADVVFHVYATWAGWAFDHAGWRAGDDLVVANAEFEGAPVERVAIDPDLAAFCRRHRHRMPDDYWRDPRPRARDYLLRCAPPWRTR